MPKCKKRRIETPSNGFMEWDLLSPQREFIGFENYVTAVSDPTLQKVFGNTFAYVFVCVPLMVVISLILALMLNQIVKGRSFFRLIVFIPYVTSAVAISYVWKWMFMKNGGVINGILKFFGIAPQPFLNRWRFRMGKIPLYHHSSAEPDPGLCYCHGNDPHTSSVYTGL